MTQIIKHLSLLIVSGVLLLGCGANVKSDVAQANVVSESNNDLTKMQFPEPQIWHTKEGLKVWFLSNTAIPVVDMRLTFKAGSAQPSPLQGLASISNELIGHGTQEIDEAELSLRLDTLGIDLSFDSHRDMGIISMRSLSGENFNNGVNILSKIIAKPAFPEQGLQRIVANRGVIITRNKSLPSHVVSKGFWGKMYHGHPYSKQVDGTLQSLQKINRQKIQEFYQKFYVARNGVLVIVGDLTRAEAEKKAAFISRHLPSNDVDLPILPMAKGLPTGSLEHIEVDSKQTHIRIGQLTLERSHPDYIPLHVANHVLGGGALTSVLGNEIREKRGWAYSVGSYMQPMLAGGPWIIYMQTANETAEAAIEKSLQVVGNFHSQLTDERVSNAVQYLRGNFPLNIDSNQELLGYLSMMAFYDLPANYLSLTDEKLAKITPKQVRQAWQKHMQVDKLLIVAAGKKVTQSKAERALSKKAKKRH